MVDWVGSLNGAAKAPGPSKPGEGAGNIPFAPGVMSGNLGQQTNQAPLARQVAVGRPVTAPQVPPGPADQGTAPRPGGMPQVGTGSIIDPMVYMQILDEYMKSLLESTKHPFISGIY